MESSYCAPANWGESSHIFTNGVIATVISSGETKSYPFICVAPPLLTTSTTTAETGDLKRFASAPQLMAYPGLVPRQYNNELLR